MRLAEIMSQTKQMRDEITIKKVSNDGYNELLGVSVLLLLVLSFIFRDFSLHSIWGWRIIYVPVICLIISDLIRFEGTRQLLFSYTYFYNRIYPNLEYNEVITSFPRFLINYKRYSQNVEYSEDITSFPTFLIDYKRYSQFII